MPKHSMDIRWDQSPQIGRDTYKGAVYIFVIVIYKYVNFVLGMCYTFFVGKARREAR